MSNPFRSKMQVSSSARNAHQPDWDGKGKHPVLGLTKEEILALNEQVSDTHADTHADSKEKKEQPDFATESVLQTGRAQENQKNFVENLADSVTTRK